LIIDIVPGGLVGDLGHGKVDVDSCKFLSFPASVGDIFVLYTQYPFLLSGISGGLGSLRHLSPFR
jgi:hypothetical protein